LYTAHRSKVWLELDKLSINKVTTQLDPNTTAQVLNRSKIAISPYGMGELCYRDLEAIQHGCIVIKPDMSQVITEPNLFIPYETYIPCNVNYSDLNEIVTNILDNYNDYLYIVENARKRLTDVYSSHNVAMHWYNFFANLSGISNES
jgi:hypothetical protein